MDRLLRRYSRLRGETLRANGEASNDAEIEAASGSHLDADEMNAYAEGALPEAARSRYFAHLADCDSCRKLVTDLTLAASRADDGKARVASLGTTPQKSWREWLAAIFSPPVLRYGVPALALFAVIIVAIVATRTRREDSSVAQNKGESRYSAPAADTGSTSATQNTTATGTTGSLSNDNMAPLVAEQSPTQPGVAATPPPAKSETLKDGVPVVAQEQPPKSATMPTDDSKNSSGEFGVADKREQREVAEASPPPPASQPPVLSKSATPTEADKEDAQKKAKESGRDDRDETAISGKSGAGRVVVDQTKPAEARPNMGGAATTTASRAAQNEPRRKAAPAAKSGPSSNSVAREEERQERFAETSNVGGRRFRKQGSQWIDTAYRSTQLTNVARGSEQYRALVADEPTLRKIAEHFGGEVIVVWKNRAYRFY